MSPRAWLWAIPLALLCWFALFRLYDFITAALPALPF